MFTSPTVSGPTRTSTSCRDEAVSRAPTCWNGWRVAATTAASCSRSTRVVRSIVTSARPTLPKVSRSRGSTSPRRHRRDGGLMSQEPVSRQLFDHVAATYDAHRPDYPGELFDVLESAMGQPLLRAEVLDVGAGTGIATRALAGRGAKVVAVDPGPGVLTLLRARSTSRVRPVV